MANFFYMYFVFLITVSCRFFLHIFLFLFILYLNFLQKSNIAILIHHFTFRFPAVILLIFVFPLFITHLDESFHNQSENHQFLIFHPFEYLNL